MRNGFPRGSLRFTKFNKIKSTLQYNAFSSRLSSNKMNYAQRQFSSLWMLWNFCYDKQGSEDFSVNAFPVYLCNF